MNDIQAVLNFNTMSLEFNMGGVQNALYDFSTMSMKGPKLSGNFPIPGTMTFSIGETKQFPKSTMEKVNAVINRIEAIPLVGSLIAGTRIVLCGLGSIGTGVATASCYLVGEKQAAHVA